MALKDELRRRLYDLDALKDMSPQQRGFELESLLWRAAEAEGLEALPSFRPRGEQVDGLIVFERTPLLLEAKWTSIPVPASEVYAFRGKVEGMLVGTVGLFVSFWGFSESVQDVIRYGRSLNVILADGHDVLWALDDDCSFSEVLRVKLRRAAQYGEVFYRYSRYRDERAL